MKKILGSDRSIKSSLLVSLLLTASACQQAAAPQSANAGSQPSASSAEQSSSAGAGALYGPPARLGTLEESAIKESSGIVASRTTPGVYWTHNDSGAGPFIYAFDSRGGGRGVWRVTGAAARDWEDMAAGPGPTRGTNYLYIGDVGDNDGRRSEIIVYRIPEPTIKAEDTDSKKSKPQSTEVAEAIRLRYPEGKHDAEALLVHPVTGNIYILTKIPFANPTIYEAHAPFSTSETTTLVRIGELKIPGHFGGITGGTISPDGLRVALCDYLRGYEIVLANSGAEFNTIWKQPLRPIDIGQREQGEAIGYRLDGKALLATSEGRRAPLIQVARP